MQKAGIVLSGGGARAIAHLGVLRALEEQDFHPAALAGSSAGALIAALYASGLSPEKIKDLFQDSAYFGVFHLLFGRPGLFDMRAMRSTLETWLPAKNFEDLPVPLYVAATNLTTGRSEIISSGPLLEPLLASACVPIIFEPVLYRGCQWVDGGVLNNFPVEPLLRHGHFIIGSHVNRLTDHLPPDPAPHKSQVLERCFHLAIAHDVYQKATHCDIFLDHPGLTGFGMFDTKKADHLFRLGYEYCLQALSVRY
ncbi:MAG TPA: patatin-like phospholipase family protein [Puia sp.]|uniref:patatin-like phospholipase family protein n=1 Tax=Puia sp. TaxID=2045100 RepID=UPI002B7BBD9C|nr:patatin-like phospholipase family protein [Puia sp.]HVU94132.1 patatin-like phospholipase family protein [Puia sp.]